MFDQQRIGRITWGGLTFGPGSRYHVSGSTGIDDLPSLRTQDVARVGADGDHMGTDYAEPRRPALTLGIRGDTPDELRALVQALKRACGRGATGPLVFLDWGVQFTTARLRRRSIPYDAEALWRIGTADLEWYCPDPRVYSIAEQTATTGLPVAEPGLDWGPVPTQMLPVGQAAGSTPTGQWSVSATVTLGSSGGAATITPTAPAGEIDWQRDLGAHSGWPCTPGQRVQFTSDLVTVRGATPGVYWWDGTEWAFVGETAGTPGVPLDVVVPAGAAYVQPWVRVAAASAAVPIGASTLHIGNQAGLEWVAGAGGLDWGPPGSTGDVTVTNEGDAETYPVIEIAGPVDRPSVTNLSTGDVLEYDIDLGAGDVLVVDTAAGTVRLGGQDRLHTITARSVPEESFTLAPGTSDLAFRGDDSGPTGGSMTVRWRSAMW